jgi:hypothetical protein
LGGVVFGWTIGEAMSLELLDAFVDAGFSLVELPRAILFGLQIASGANQKP